MGLAASKRARLPIANVTTSVEGVKAKHLRRLILSGKLAPCYEGQDEDDTGKVRADLARSLVAQAFAHTGQIIMARNSSLCVRGRSSRNALYACDIILF